jgi:hypothetical protein
MKMMKNLLLLVFILTSFHSISQNVGIGTPSPLQKLHVEGSTFLNGNVGIGVSAPPFPLSFSPSLGDKISLWSNSTNSYGLGIQSSLLQIHTDIWASDIAFGYGSSAAFTENMRIKGDGNVGIGTATPVQKLHVEGTTFLNGNVGIGTSTPYARLSFAGNSSGEIISFNGTTTNNYGIGIQLGLLQIHTNVAAADIAFGYGSSASFTERMRIKGNGKVGIGTSNPSHSLQVEGTTFLNGNVGIGGLGPSGHKLVVAGTTFLDGNVGIGTFAGVSEKLRVAGFTFIDGPTFLNGDLEVSSGYAAKPGGGPWFASSDARLKETVIPYTDGLSTLLKINPVKYHYNHLSGYDTKPEYIGVLAQDIKSIIPYMVGTFQKKGESYYYVDNSAMTYMLINAVKEQQLMISKLEQQIDELKQLVEKKLNNENR